jgi:hypothetical protein
VAATREQMLELGWELIGDRDLEPALEVLRELAQFSQFSELIDRRRELYEGQREKNGVGAARGGG